MAFLTGIDSGYFRFDELGQSHSRKVQGQQSSSLLDREREGGRLLRKLQILRAIRGLPDGIAALWIGGFAAGDERGGGGEDERRHGGGVGRGMARFGRRASSR